MKCQKLNKRIFEHFRNLRFRKKAQIISMDFILTFVVYLFAISIFFFAINESYFSKQIDLDINSELMFSKLSNVYDEDYSFLENSKIIPDFDVFLSSYNPVVAYEKYFQSFDNLVFKDIDYCIYLERDNDIIRNFDVYSENSEDYSIFILHDGFEVKCGTNKLNQYLNDPILDCRSDESIILIKPVLFNGEIVNLKVLACGERI